MSRVSNSLYVSLTPFMDQTSGTADVWFYLRFSQ
jgi:hypothetical protein